MKIRRLWWTTCGVPGYRLRAPVLLHAQFYGNWSRGDAKWIAWVPDVPALRGEQGGTTDPEDAIEPLRHLLAESVERLRNRVVTLPAGVEAFIREHLVPLEAKP